VKRHALILVSALALLMAPAADPSTAIIYSADPGGSGGTYWHNTWIYCQSGTARTWWVYTLTYEWRCAYRQEL
jgi:hypothetical protein